MQNGTLITFTTTIGRIEPSEARTHNGQVTVKLITGGDQRHSRPSPPIPAARRRRPPILKIGTAAAKTVSVTTTPQSLGASGGTVQVVATVVDDGGSRVGGVPVTLSTDKGSISPSTATTDGSGNATATLTTNATVEDHGDCRRADRLGHRHGQRAQPRVVHREPAGDERRRAGRPSPSRPRPARTSRTCTWISATATAQDLGRHHAARRPCRTPTRRRGSTPPRRRRATSPATADRSRPTVIIGSLADHAQRHPEPGRGQFPRHLHGRRRRGSAQVDHYDWSRSTTAPRSRPVAAVHARPSRRGA